MICGIAGFETVEGERWKWEGSGEIGGIGRDNRVQRCGTRCASRVDQRTIFYLWTCKLEGVLRYMSIACHIHSLSFLYLLTRTLYYGLTYLVQGMPRFASVVRGLRLRSRLISETKGIKK